MKKFILLFVVLFTAGIFSQVQFTPHTITTNAVNARSVYAVDIDGDGDMDVLSASASDDKIAWYENDGNESFTPHTITTNADGAISVYAVDIDGDGDIDVLSASRYDNKIAWYENMGVTSIEDNISTPNTTILFNNYPNPFNPNTKIKYTIPQVSFVSIRIFNVLGTEVDILVNEEKEMGTYELSWNASDLPSGVYFYNLQADTFNETKSMLLMK